MKGKLKYTQYNTFPRAKNSSIKHYQKMIEWVKRTQQLDHFPDATKMMSEIGENWTAHYCSFCAYSYLLYASVAIHGNVCEFCPIGKVSGSGSCLFTPWDRMEKAETWEAWLEAAEEEVEFLKKLKG